jgi:hypothetical protein
MKTFLFESQIGRRNESWKKRKQVHPFDEWEPRNEQLRASTAAKTQFQTTRGTRRD